MRYWQCLVLVVVAYQGYTQVPVIRNVQPNYGYPRAGDQHTRRGLRQQHRGALLVG